jgi:hypothetical protein
MHSAFFSPFIKDVIFVERGRKEAIHSNHKRKHQDAFPPTVASQRGTSSQKKIFCCLQKALTMKKLQ